MLFRMVPSATPTTSSSPRLGFTIAIMSGMAKATHRCSAEITLREMALSHPDEVSPTAVWADFDNNLKMLLLQEI